MSETPKNGTPVTLAQVYEVIADRVEPRLRRVEYAAIALLVATASPKLGGPSAPDVISSLLSL